MSDGALPGKTICLSLKREGRTAATLRIWAVRASAESAARSAVPSDEPLHLVETRTYGYALEASSGVAFAGPLEPQELLEPDHPGSLRGRLKPGNRAGLVVFGVPLADTSYACAELEVASKKLRYDDEYQWMLQDLSADLVEVVLARFGATQTRYAALESGEPLTLYQRFAFTQAVLACDEFRGALQQVITRPHVAWERHTETRLATQGMRASHATLRAIAKGGPRTPLPARIGAIDAVPRFSPREVLRPTTNNIPNQFIQMILEEWRDFGSLVQERLLAEDRATKKPVAPVRRGIAETQRFIDELDGILARPLFRSQSRLTRLPVANQVLLRRPGYRELIRLHLQAQLAAALTWDGAEDVFEAGQRDVATLYEYWVFLQLGRIVSSICGGTFDFSDMFRVSSSGLQLSLRKKRTQVVRGSIQIAGQELFLGLWFNRAFKRSSGESWSRDMRPDLSLSIGSSQDSSALEMIWLHFDAKYRVENLKEILGSGEIDLQEEDSSSSGLGAQVQPKDRALRSDLLKMHAYRDAIRRSSGAYVIYPGDESAKEDETFLEYHELLPGLGAFALRPAAAAAPKGRGGIETFLSDVLAHSADVLSRECRLLDWESRIMGAIPVPAKTIAAAARDATGLGFLSAHPDDESLVILASTVAAWDEQNGRLLIRNVKSRVPARVFKARWAIASVGDSVALVNLGSEPSLEEAASTAGRFSLQIAGVSCPQLPEWLTREALLELLGERESLLLSWGEAARQVLD